MPTFFGIEYPNVPDATDGIYEVVLGTSLPYFHGSCWSVATLKYFPNDQILKAFKDPPTEEFPFGKFRESKLVNLPSWNVVNGTKAGLVISKTLDKMAGCDFDIVGRTDLDDYPDCAERAAECVTELTAYRAYLAQFKTLFAESGPILDNVNANAENMKERGWLNNAANNLLGGLFGSATNPGGDETAWWFGEPDWYRTPVEAGQGGACRIYGDDIAVMKGNWLYFNELIDTAIAATQQCLDALYSYQETIIEVVETVLYVEETYLAYLEVEAQNIELETKINQAVFTQNFSQLAMIGAAGFLIADQTKILK